MDASENTPVSESRWTREALEQTGFIGWVLWSSCPASLEAIDPNAGGVYVVYRGGALDPAFLDQSPAGTFRGDPSVPRDALDANWVPGARVVYIGKAGLAARVGYLRSRIPSSCCAWPSASRAR